uniref:Ig-like domain-containing protein n=1 Tax=Sparus aurata TaxID=8175 RepID=A0A671UW79_SPAAU
MCYSQTYVLICFLFHRTNCHSPDSVSFGSMPTWVTLLSVPRGDTQALVCTIDYFAPKELTVNWKKNAHNVPGSTDWKPESIGNKFSAVSILNVNNTDWDNKDVYKCEVTHAGTQYTKKASKAQGNSIEC